ncbi:MAG: DUF2235 domain-containing protein [Nitrospirales bacterium]|nr:DUF2235 domain-containing protein [Nitrospira sp.]MDR4500034.1 DUF2235 domain-containing protein [Nitrospirales bacterium]
MSLHSPAFKKIVICCDGTWNKPEVAMNSKRYRPTNVLRIARAVSNVDEQFHHQIIYYDSGIGTDGGLGHRLIGGLTGYGLSARIMKAYRFVCHNYVEGDVLYFFGFSRGAYTVRALAGMIGAVGLLHANDLHHLPTAFRYYNTHPKQRPSLPFAKAFIASHHTRSVRIKFLGVWDTVGALGIPIPYLRPFTKKWVGFFNTELGSHVEHGYHALAIDERRRPFKPNLWSRYEQSPGSATKDVCQVWFPGSHSDVGGGADDTTLSDESLLWMVNRAVQCGLHFPDHFRTDLDKTHRRESSKPQNSLSLPYKGLILIGVFPHKRIIGNRRAVERLYERTPSTSPILRNLPHRLSAPLEPVINEMIHESAFQKYVACEISAQGSCYQPPNLANAINSLPVFREKYYRTRSHIRKALNLKGQVLSQQQTEDCRVLDFSPHGGAKLQMSEPANRIGQTFILNIDDPEYRGKDYRGQVAWQSKYSLGLKFLSETGKSNDDPLRVPQ